ncbi:alkaline phosphatase family protein [Fodinibius salsisoli]|uniref:Alkaline phosphatase family protein n=1 Tax=Fodinibius salsisoli TaxID=2820877 RepID=A0ABT3PIV8_9BACT|nr:alkaline phosphatase family protein [Fodinibius salsisoli]MCW9705683.1 alkaline phosphatase family protein [Fodinibius salsisoli]
MAVIFLFIDGVGLGDPAEENPFLKADYHGFKSMANSQPFTNAVNEITEKNHVFKSIDATLGVEGLPQSGTGQAALFSGKNAPEIIGRHFGPFPHSGTKHLLREQSLFIKAQEQGKRCQFMNAYPDIFFRKAQKRNRWSCTTLMTKSAGIALNTTEEVKKEKALTAELTQEAWRNRLDIDVPHITPEVAAQRLIDQSVSYDLLLHEYYLTDKAGHSQDMGKAHSYLATYDRFLTHLIENKPDKCTLVLSSDHGNVEDLSIKTHTYNKVPFYAKGPGAHHLLDAESIMDVTPGILEILEDN